MLRAMSRAGGGLLGGGLLRRASAALAAEPASARVAAPASVAPWMIGGGASASSSRPILGAPLGARFVGASAASLAKPGRIKEYALFKDHHFDELGIPRPGSERRRRRVGLVAVKCGMTREWNEHGVSVPLTVLWVDDCEVRTPRRRARIPPRRRLSARPSPAAPSVPLARAIADDRPLVRLARVRSRKTTSRRAPRRGTLNLDRAGGRRFRSFVSALFPPPSPLTPTAPRPPLLPHSTDRHPQVVKQVTDKPGHFALQLGAGSKKPKQLTRAALGHFAAHGVSPKRVLSEFPVSEDAMLPAGTKLGASHFVPGQHVDVQGRTIGKGFQGPMKRWGFSGLPASHGTTKKHRAHGSIGNSQDPGRVFKGKKMAGRMGNRLRTVKNALVYKVDPARNLLYVVGQVPGKAGTFQRVTDAVFKPPDFSVVPYPGGGEADADADGGAAMEVRTAKMRDPFATHGAEAAGQEAAA